MKPIIRSGEFHSGAGLVCGENVVIDVAEDVIVGDRCVLPDNAYLSGRHITIGDDFYGYSWSDDYQLKRLDNSGVSHDSHYDSVRVGSRLDIGRGRRDEEEAILIVGDRCTFHNTRIDLSKRITIGHDVGLSPEVVIYTHSYWGNPLEGFPYRREPVYIWSNVLVGFRSVLLPGAVVGSNSVIGAQSVVFGALEDGGVYAGSPARLIRKIKPLPTGERIQFVQSVLDDYRGSLDYRFGNRHVAPKLDYPLISLAGCTFDLETRLTQGSEGELTDDFRWFLFQRGFRFYTLRPFKSLERTI